jgi:bacterioferritin-associated ferredoxin
MNFASWLLREDDEAVKQAIQKGIETYKQLTKPAPPASQKKQIMAKLLTAETQDDLVAAVRQMTDSGISFSKKKTAKQSLTKWMMESRRFKKL